MLESIIELIKTNKVIFNLIVAIVILLGLLIFGYIRKGVKKTHQYLSKKIDQEPVCFYGMVISLSLYLLSPILPLLPLATAIGCGLILFFNDKDTSLSTKMLEKTEKSKRNLGIYRKG